jgi:hypothetical protein
MFVLLFLQVFLVSVNKMESEIYVVKTDWWDMPKITGSTEVIIARASKARKPFNLLFSNLKRGVGNGGGG